MSTQKTYRPLPPDVTIKQSEIDGFGVFATRTIPADTVIGVARVEDERFLNGYIRTPLGGFINHSETPNCEIIADDEPGREGIFNLKSIRQIKTMAELTVRYALYDPAP